ncbi:molybdopterin-synthase adenylyltransferase MoeB [Azospirillum brasilense]|uniref:Molybdopterin-synthase adenylyltransferase n=1 Tax=Azospirillum brasilense TaxID=192 RepID=A0A0P0F0X2_AZOBR|nr:MULTISPECIES: molybdopterin-synthase adenylyltransferase MoeB [Azospirillum]ALJ34118.1 adenylyltransferase [Azospirillum brasilense]MDW7552905.1 molybdopterin-synthase adenylyltransferase MoeB [Azospirillum brasilense]MDW7591903.1 molybdopterin-synthase adenylyltransferase MoeB [Azospirillum brasilense]MDW7627820.1 molybdopterin-synthase adenylyltransferase MoeB [Azospirillum brasilense]MDX5952711.1 molybdopterin-synthase adenylyltransferase MoeB [Azospirillum brasilense]
MDFTDTQLHRYSRHIILPEVGGVGQEALLRARVLVVGAGGLGAPLLLYLAAAGVGTIGVIDDDTVDLSNLQRQVIHDESSLGVPKVESAAARIRALNPDVAVEVHKMRLTKDNALDLIGRYDIVADGSDNFATRFLLNDACYFAGKTLVSAAILRFDGQVSTFKAHLGDPHPCYRCLFPEPPPRGLVPSCSEGGVLGALAGFVGSLQTTEVLKEIMGIGEGLSGSLMMLDTLHASFQRITVRRDPDCPLCGAHPTIHDLSAH